MLRVMIILIAWDDDEFGGSEVYMLRVMIISLEVWRFIHCV